MEENRLIFNLCARLLNYPDPELYRNPEVQDCLSIIDNSSTRQKFQTFLDYMNGLSFEDYCESYVKQFDFSDQSTLYLTYGVFGDNRERGLGFVKLKMEFAKADFYLKVDELPDFLPLILEFACIAEEKHVMIQFHIHRKAIEALHQSLLKQASPFAVLLEICSKTIARLLAIPQQELEEGNAS